MSTTSRLIFLCLLARGLLGGASADVLQLKDGKTLNGHYLGGTASTIAFDAGAGVQVFNTTQVQALSFPASPAASPPASTAAPQAAQGATSLAIPAGTKLLVRLVDPVSSKDAAGKRFTATLETDLGAGAGVVRAGTKVYGRVEKSQQAGRYAGQSALDLRLTELAAGGASTPIVTGPYTQSGAKSGGKTARGAAGGAAIGAIADGGDGAAKGAAIGAVASGLRKGQAVSLPAGSLLEFQLSQPVTVSINP